MKKLKKAVLKDIEVKLIRDARKLEIEYFNILTKDADANNYLCELEKYQNEDGGFGNALEPDVRLPMSSAIGTSIALRNLCKFDKHDSAKAMVKKAIFYLEETFDRERIGWYIVGEEVNDYPHAPWWTFDKEINMTVLDYNWGNPSAELLGYLIRYSNYVTNIDINEVIKKAMNNIMNSKSYESFHEIYCYCALANHMSGEKLELLENELSKAIKLLACDDPSKWYRDYVAMPIDFVNSTRLTFGVTNDLIDKNLDMLIDRLESEILINPHWDLEGKLYFDDMKAARDEWSGVLTIEFIEKLIEWGRIE